MRSSPHYRWWALGVLLIGFFSTGISITILSAVLPTIADEFGVGTHTIAWVVTGPMLVVGILTPTMGKAGDLFGRKRVYLLGWSVASIFYGMAALSWDAGSLIAFRMIAAAAGAATGPTAMALILSAFRPDQRVTAMGWWSFMGAGAPVIGLVAGGPLVDAVGWRWIFGVTPPLALPGIVIAALVLRPDRPDVRPRFDVAGSVLLGAAVGSLLFGLNRGGAQMGWDRPDVIVPLLLFPAFLASFIATERRQPEPLINLAYFRDRNVVVPLSLQFLGHAPYMGSFFLAPFLLERILGYDHTRTAFVLLPRPLANSLMSAFAGYAAVKVGERTTAVGGMAAMTAGLLGMATIGPASTFPLIAFALGGVGLGMGVSLPSLVASVANAVDERDFGAMSAAQSMTMMVGQVIGIQTLQTIQAEIAGRAGDLAGFRGAFLVGAAMAAVGAVLGFSIRSKHKGATVPPEESPEAPLIPEPIREP